MLVLLGMTLSASFVDSLNPSAIAQQMLLQAMVKKKKHIWFFISGIGLANFVLGLAVYYGVIEWVTKLFSSLTAKYPLYVYGAEIAVAVICAVIGIILIIKTKHAKTAENQNDVKTPASLAPLSLFVMGAAFCAVELTSALPYFGFLTMLATYKLSLPLVIAFILIYCLIYVLPLILLYFGYNRLQGTKAVKMLERMFGKISAYIVPVVLTGLGVFLLYKGVSSFLIL